MEKIQLYQTLSQIFTMLCIVGTGVFGYLSYHYGIKKEKLEKKEVSTSINTIQQNQINNEYKVLKVTNFANNKNQITNKIDNSKSFKTTIQLNQSVKNINQSGGITAHTVIVPEDNVVYIKDNYSIKEYQLDPGRWSERKGYLIKTKQGNWAEPFVAYLNIETDKVKGGISTVDGWCQNSSGTVEMINANNETKMFYYEKFNGISVNRDLGMLFTFYEKPSFIVFGDFRNKEKWYTFKF